MRADTRSGPWLGRYTHPLPVRSRGAFHLVSVERPEGRALVVVGSRTADVVRVRSALDEVARVHRLLDDPLIPQVTLRAEHEGVPFVELACDAAIDGHEVLRLLGDARIKMPYGRGDAIFTLLRTAMQAAHRVTDPLTGRPVCLGQVSYGNLLFSPSGRMSVVGFGFNFPVLKENGSPEGLAPVFQAPEVLAGDPPQPVSDYVAVLMAARSLTSFCDIGEITQRVLRASISADNLELYETVRYFESRFIAEPPAFRPTIEEGIAKSARLREILGTTVDVEGLFRTVAELLTESAPKEETGRVTIAADGAYLELPSGQRHALGRAHRQLLRVLLGAHQRSPERRFDVWELLEAGWPGEDPIPEAGANRVYVAVARLRQLGLRDVLESEGGYRLRPGAPFRVAGLFG